MSEKLKPCPFCSKAAELDTLKIITPSGMHKSIRIAKCQCGGLMLGFSESEAITAWNNRTLSKTETVKYLEIEAIKNDHSGEANGTVEPVKNHYKSNEPLTLEELKQIGEEPVWFCNLEKSREFLNGWYQFGYEHKEFLAFFTFGNECEEIYRTDNCGKTWLAYRHKKEEGE